MKILVADDEHMIRDILVDLLREKGFDVTSANDGLEAWSSIESQDFDIVILDESMPGLRGSDIALRLLAMPEHPQILMVTGHQDLVSSLSRRVTLLSKPFTIPVFLAAVNNLVSAKC